MEIQLLTFWSPESRDCSDTQNVSHRVTNITCRGFGWVRLRYKWQWQVREPSSGVGARTWKSCVQENQLLSLNSGLRDDHWPPQFGGCFSSDPVPCPDLQKTIALSTREMGLFYRAFFVRNFMLDLRLRAMLKCSQLLKYCSPYWKKRWNAGNKAPFSGDFSGCQVDITLANTVCNVSATKATISMDMSKRIFLLV